MTLDSINSLFEVIFAAFIWLNVRRLYLDKTVSGVSLWVQGFGGLYGLWACFYYWSITHFYSLAGQIVMVLGTWTWLGLVLWYRRK